MAQLNRFQDKRRVKENKDRLRSKWESAAAIDFSLCVWESFYSFIITGKEEEEEGDECSKTL